MCVLIATARQPGTCVNQPHTTLLASAVCVVAQVVAVASDDGSIRCFNTRTGELICELQGHEDAVQAALFDAQPAAGAGPDSSEILISCGSDATFKIWS